MTFDDIRYRLGTGPGQGETLGIGRTEVVSGVNVVSDVVVGDAEVFPIHTSSAWVFEEERN